MGCHFLLQGIFLIEGLNWHFLSLMHCRQILYLLSHLGGALYSNILNIYWLIEAIALGVREIEKLVRDSLYSEISCEIYKHALDYFIRQKIYAMREA